MWWSKNDRWYSMVVQFKGQSMREAILDPEQFLCSYDGRIYGGRQAKKMAKRAGHSFIKSGLDGTPRLVGSPMEPFGPEELTEVVRALDKGLVPPH